MKKYYLVLLLLGVVGVSFQNCAPSNKLQTLNDTTPNSKASTVSEPISNANIAEFTYSPGGFESQKLSSNSEYLNVNLATGVISKSDRLGDGKFQIPNEDRELAQQVFNNAKICSFELPPETAVCMAYAMPDNSFVDSNGQVKYVSSGTICYQEYLCEDSRNEIKKFLSRYNINISF